MKDGSVSRSETLDHMLRVYGNTPSEKAVIEPQLLNVFSGSRGWSGKVYVDKGKVRAHVITQKTPPLGRFVRQEFDSGGLQHSEGTLSSLVLCISRVLV